MAVDRPRLSGISRFQTESGSHYEIDYARRTWTRLVAGSGSEMVRGQEGPFDSISPIVRDQPVIIHGPPLTVGMDLRRIETTPVTMIDGDQDSPKTAQ